MQLFPSQSFVLQSDLDIEVIKGRLLQNIEPKKIFRTSYYSAKPFEGSWNGNSFSISLVALGRKTGKPIITGNLERQGEGTKLYIKTGVFNQVKFVMVWMMLLSSIAIISMIVVSIQHRKFELYYLLVLLFLIPPVVLYQNMCNEFEEGTEQTKVFFEALTKDV